MRKLNEPEAPLIEVVAELAPDVPVEEELWERHVGGCAVSEEIDPHLDADFRIREDAGDQIEVNFSGRHGVGDEVEPHHIGVPAEAAYPLTEDAWGDVGDEAMLLEADVHVLLQQLWLSRACISGWRQSELQLSISAG